jgi:DNA replication protein DnaC
MEQASNHIGKALSNLETLAKNANPIKEGDWYNGEGILHCGKCGQPMEHITRLENIQIKPEAIDDMDYEHRKIVEETRRMLAGRKHRIPCRCQENERQEYEKAQRKRMIMDNRNACFGKTPALFDFTFEFDDNPECNASQVSRRYSEEFTKYKESGWGLVYVGEVGHGKTYYACAVANKLLWKGYKVKYTNINDIIALTSKGCIPLSFVIDGLCENDLIIIDDLGAEEASDRMQARTFQIINTLSERKKSLIITSNISANELRNAPTAEAKRIYSRILDRSTILTVNSEKGDRRIRR